MLSVLKSPKNKAKPDGKQKTSRRIFLENILCGSLAACLTASNKLLAETKKKDRLKKGQMFYRRLGRTNLFISEISLGGSPLPDWAILLEAVERGVNYIDTSESYQNGNSERQIGQLFREIGRDKIYVGTKFHLRRNWSEKSIINSANNSLKRLRTDYLDVLLIHGAESEDQLTDQRVISAFEKLKKEGKYRFRGLSCHKNHHRVVKKAIECGYYDMVQLGYNIFDIQQTEPEIEVYDDYLGASGIRHLLALARSNDVGVIAMKTLKVGGRRQNLEKYQTGSTPIFQAMLKWVLDNKNVASVVTEMLTFGQLQEDLGVIGQSLSQKERKNLFRYVLENSKNYCHMCGLCESHCPSRIKTTSILHYLIYYETYRKISSAKKAYSRLSPSQTSASCQDCGECERACPYGVSIRKRIRKAQQLLG